MADDLTEAEPAWRRMEWLVEECIAEHPMVRMFVVSITGEAEAVTASLEYGGEIISARLDDPSWWQPATPERARQVATRLGNRLYDTWLEHLR